MEKTNQYSYSHQGYAVKWRIVNELGLIFTCVYREILQITHIEQLLELIDSQFVKEMLPKLDMEGGVYQSLPAPFDDKFGQILRHWDKNIVNKKIQKMRTFDQSSKNKKKSGIIKD